LALFAYANTLVLQHSMPRMTFKASSTMFILYVDKRENQQQCSMIDVIVIADACLLILLIQKFLQKNWYLFEKLAWKPFHYDINILVMINEGAMLYDFICIIAQKDLQSSSQ